MKKIFLVIVLIFSLTLIFAGEYRDHIGVVKLENPATNEILFYKSDNGVLVLVNSDSLNLNKVSVDSLNGADIKNANAGYVLQSDGDSTLSFVAPTADTLWKLQDSEVSLTDTTNTVDIDKLADDVDVQGNSIENAVLNKSLSQGLAWDQANDEYERLGSLAGLTKSTSPGNDYLPIQSDMKRCVMNDDGTVNYYLDADNSAMKQYTTIPLQDTVSWVSGDSIKVSSATFSTIADTGMWVQNVDSTYWAEIQTVVNDSVLVLHDSVFTVGDSIEQYNAILNGDDGQVMVEIPKFYYKQYKTGNIFYWYASKYDLSGFELHPAFWKNGQEVNYRYYSAFEGSMYDNSEGAMTAKGSITSGMFNTGDKMCSVAGQWAKTNEQQGEYRTMASNRGAGWRSLDFTLNSAIQLLYLIEYADFHTQSTIGDGRTTLGGGSWAADSYIGMTGFSIADGNGTNSVASGGFLTDYMTYRGIENWYGNVWKILNGITWDGRWTGTEAAQPVYYTNNSTYFKDSGSTNMRFLTNASYIGSDAGYIGDIENTFGFIPSAAGGSASTELTDYYWQYSESGRDYWRLVRFGGIAGYGDAAGGFALRVSDAWSLDNAAFGGRLCY